MFERFFPTKAPLTGAPATPRMKTYSASSGYVYHYYYQGRRGAGPGGRAVTEYVFSVSTDRLRWRPLTLALSEKALAGWREGGGRDLTSTERYAVAKMALFQAFDDHAVPEALPAEVNVARARLETIAAALGWD